MTESTTGSGQQDRDRSWHHFSEVLQGCNSFLVLNQETDALCSVPSLPFPAAVKLTAICNQYRPCRSRSVAGQKGSGAAGCCMPVVPSSCVQLEVPSPPLPLRPLLAGSSRCTVRTGALHGGGDGRCRSTVFSHWAVFLVLCSSTSIDSHCTLLGLLGMLLHLSPYYIFSLA